jgi:peptide/nickel transport system permease protein
MADEVNPPGGNAWGLAVVFARPLLSFVATLAGAVFFVSALLYFAPGNAADVVANDETLRQGLLEEWGLDQGLWAQYTTFLGNALHGDFGNSLTFRPGTPVSQIILERAGSSIRLVLGALFMSLFLGLGLAYWTAGRKTLTKRILQVLSVPPVFLLAYLTMVNLDAWAFENTVAVGGTPPNWFPLMMNPSALKTALAMTLLAVGSSALTEIHAALEGDLEQIRHSGYVDAARARGATLWPHTLSNLLPRMTTLASSRMAFYLGGVIVVEKVFALNGVGTTLWEACRLRDYPLALGITLVAAALVCAARLLGDWVRMALDPRQRGGA